MSVVDLLLGRPLASREINKQKISLLSGLPALGLDGLSSSAYGPEAALTILLPLGAIGLNFILPITAIILAILAMLYFSYCQTIAAYPQNGGSYTVAKENLGTWPSLFAAAALMIDYVLTAAVGISAGVAAVVSAMPQFQKYTLPLCLGILALVTLLNLRGVAEAGAAFALPTYVFILSMLTVLGIGIVKSILHVGHPHPLSPAPPLPVATAGVGIWILLRSFASGCTAMTGVEAVSNGVGAFKEPTVKNAHRTLTLIVVILAILLAAIAYLCRAYQIGAMPQDQSNYQSVLSQLIAAIVGKGWFYYLTMTSVLLVLCLSANTAFVGFPRLCRTIAKDDFLPRSFAAAGRRLVYSVGVLFLASAAALLLTTFRGVTDRLIPLYAVGAFLAFTLSQSGMVMHWRKQMRQNNKKAPTSLYLKLSINGIGAAATAAALCIILAAKFIEGAWITVLAIPVILALFWSVHRHYRFIESKIQCHDPMEITHQTQLVVLVPINRWNRLTAKSLRFAMQLSADVIAIHLSNLEGDAAADEAANLRKQWDNLVTQPAAAAGLIPPKLDLITTPYRQFITPLLAHLQDIKRQYPNRLVAVVIPQIIEKHWWHSILHSRRASRLRSALRARLDSHVIVVELPWVVNQ